MMLAKYVGLMILTSNVPDHFSEKQKSKLSLSRRMRIKKKINKPQLPIFLANQNGFAFNLPSCISLTKLSKKETKKKHVGEKRATHDLAVKKKVRDCVSSGIKKVP